MEDKSNSTFFNKRYLTISLYAMLVLLFAAVVFSVLGNLPAVIKFLRYIWNILSPFILGICFAFIISPLINQIKKKVTSKIFKGKASKAANYTAIFMGYICILGIIILLLFFIVPQIYYSLVDLSNNITLQYFAIVEALNESPTELYNVDANNIISFLQNYVPQVVSYISQLTSNLLPIIYNSSITFIKGIWNIILGFIVSVYIIADSDNLLKSTKKLLYAIIPVNSSHFMINTMREAVNIFSKYIIGKTIDSLIIGFLTFILMTIIGFDFKILISVLVGVTNMIPYFGPFIGGAIGCVILLINSPIDAIVFAVLILIIQQFDGLYLGPKILGSSTGLKPLWVIFGIMVGGSLFGVVGMLIGVPLVAVLSYILNELIDYRLQQRDINYQDGHTHSISRKKPN